LSLEKVDGCFDGDIRILPSVDNRAVCSGERISKSIKRTLSSRAVERRGDNVDVALRVLIVA
jgi:hypothetical protein